MVACLLTVTLVVGVQTYDAFAKICFCIYAALMSQSTTHVHNNDVVQRMRCKGNWGQLLRPANNSCVCALLLNRAVVLPHDNDMNNVSYT